MNPFRQLWDLGYKNLIPVVPPEAPISERSSIATRLADGKDDRGKTPGVRGRDGLWFGLDWLPYTADEQDLDRWHEMGASVGLKMGFDGVVMIDADTLNPEHARLIKETVDAQLGALPIRVGNHPKAGYICRVGGEYRYQRIEFGERDKKGRLLDRVEILSRGRQAVVSGIHPKTKKPYRWPRPLPAIHDLPVVKPEQLTALLQALAKVLPQATEVATEGAAALADQALLKGDLALVRRAVALTPNTSANFPTRESYRDYGYAIKAALVDHPDEAFEIYSEWCARWTDGQNEPGIVEADWRRMKPPFRVGAHRIYDLAEQHSDGAFTRAEQWFEEIPEHDFIGAVSTSSGAKPEPIKWLRPSQWVGKEPPPREWEVEGWIPRKEITLLYGDGGIGKTLVAHQYATCAAAGVDWLGQKTRKARVMTYFCEDGEDELHRRQIDINRHLGIDMADIDDSLRITSRRHHDNLLALWNRNTGGMQLQAVWEQLRNDALAFKADVVILDTLADIYSGSEIERAQVSTFVKACLGRLMAQTGGTLIVLGHPSQSGLKSGSGTSGSTGWNNAVRSRLYLRYPGKATTGDIRELETMKSNYGKKGSMLKLRWSRGAFEVIAGANLSDSSTRSTTVYEDGQPQIVELAQAAEAAVLNALRLCADVPMNLNPRSPKYAGKVLLHREPEVLQAYTSIEVETAVLALEKRGVLKQDTIGWDASRHALKGVVIDDGKLRSGAVSIFD